MRLLLARHYFSDSPLSQKVYNIHKAQKWLKLHTTNEHIFERTSYFKFIFTTQHDLTSKCSENPKREKTNLKNNACELNDLSVLYFYTSSTKQSNAWRFQHEMVFNILKIY